MSRSWWIKLNDVRVNVNAQTNGDPLAVAMALSQLYQPPVEPDFGDDYFDDAYDHAQEDTA